MASNLAYGPQIVTEKLWMLIDPKDGHHGSTIRNLVKNNSGADRTLQADINILGTPTITDDNYWDCECEKRYIHKVKDISICPKCNADFHDGMPNSRVNEMTDKSRFYKGGNNG